VDFNASTNVSFRYRIRKLGRVIVFSEDDRYAPIVRDFRVKFLVSGDLG